MGKKRHKKTIHNKTKTNENEMINENEAPSKTNANKEIKENLEIENPVDKTLDLNKSVESIEENNSKDILEDDKFKIKEEIYIASKENKIESYEDKSMREFLEEEQKVKKEKKLRIFGFILGLFIISLFLYFFSPYSLDHFKSDVKDAVSLEMKKTDLFDHELEKTTQKEDTNISK